MSLTISQSLPKFIPLHWWCHPAVSSSGALFLFCLQSFQASGTFPMSQLFISQPKYWNFSFSNSPSNEYSGLISLKIDWFNLLAVQRTLRSLLQHHNSKASILWCSTFFTVQLSQLYATIGKPIAFTIQAFVGRVVSLLFNTLPKFLIAFLPRSNHLLILRMSHHMQWF